MEIITLKRERTNIRHKDIFPKTFVKKLVVTPYYDLDGSQIIDHENFPIKTYEDCIVRVVKETWNEFGMKFEDSTLVIDMIEQEGSVTEIKGDSEELHIKICWGEG